MVLVVGMARSGIAAARLLQSKGVPVYVSDSGKSVSAEELDAAGIQYETGGHTRWAFLEAEEIVVSPGVPLTIDPLREAREKGIPIISEIELASRYLKGDIVAITGSNGKTTTTTLIGEMMKATGRHVQVGGNIGRAMSLLVPASTATTINVIEVSSFQLDGIVAFRPNVGVLLNITPDHLDRYTDFQEYRASKFRLFENQTDRDVAVLNQDDPQVFPAAIPLRSIVRTFSRKSIVENTLFVNGQRVMSVDEIPLRGSHNVENVLAALVAAGCYSIDPAALAETIRQFKGVEHRIEFVRKIQGVEFYNDSKATNVDSAIKGVESFDRNVIIILGGKDKGASYDPLVQAMKGRVKHVLLIGAAAQKIDDAIGSLLPKTFVTTMQEAVEKGLDLGAPGDVVLLSPACASFDMFNNYEHRGRVFKEAVNGHGQEA